MNEDVESKFDKAISYILGNPIPIVYFIRCNEFIKIGSSKGNFVERRIRDLQVGNPYPIWLELFMCGTHHDERILHHKLKKLKIEHRGEWFKLNSKDVKDIVLKRYKYGK